MDDPLPRRPRRSRRGSRAADTAAQCNASACNVPSRWRPCRWPPHEATRTVALLSASLGAPAASPKQCRSLSTCALRRTARGAPGRDRAERGVALQDAASGRSTPPPVPTSPTQRRVHARGAHGGNVVCGARRRATGPSAHRASCGCRAARAAIARTAALHRGAARAPPPAAERRAASESASAAFYNAPLLPPARGARVPCAPAPRGTGRSERARAAPAGTAAAVARVHCRLSN